MRDNVALSRVREEAAGRVKLAMGQRKLSKDSVGRFRHSDTVTSIEHVEGVLKDEYSEKTADGMKGLLPVTSPTN